MVIDSSAILAILFDEPERQAFLAVIDTAPTRLMSAATLTELGLVSAGRLGPSGVNELRLLLQQFDLTIVAHDEALAEMATEAFVAFGRGRHPAALNFGDCFAYALAKATGEALLFKGNDFSQTDIRAAL